MKTGVVIVAAGITAKINDPKQLLKIGDLTMAERVVLNFQRAGLKEIVMVTGFQAKQLEKSMQHHGIAFLRNENYETTEMFDSVKIGLKFLKDRCDRILFCPVDIPFFTDDTVEQILKAEGEIVIPTCKGKSGHPIRIENKFVDDILQYEGEQGLKGAIDSIVAKKHFLEIEDEGSITDADTQDDYEHLVELHNSGLMRPDVRVRLVNKQPFFGPGTVNLLKLIDTLGSVKEACDKAGISYSKGWKMIRAAEEELGYYVVERQQGGKNGGQASVTVRGSKLLAVFERYEKEVEKAAERLYEEIMVDSGCLS